ncbi:pilus assembly protein TadG-related protein [Roseobacteraceae bacterium NS-SX3]
MLMHLRNTAAALQPAVARGRQALAAFRREEDGVLAKPAILFLLAMLAVGGIGVDLMRHERDRTMLQYTLDRAVLAAADLDQPLGYKAVVQDYLTKAGLGEYYQEPDGDSGLGYKWVDATIDSTFPAYLLKFAGGDDLPLYVHSRAEESIGSVEISMVLDISGSMNSNSRLTNLKTAAHSFIDQITKNTSTSQLSVSIIPYATQVNAGESLLSKFNVSQEHNYSHCVNFIPDQFSKHTLDRNEPLERTMHFDPFSYSENMIRYPVCPTRDGSAILPFTNDPVVLHDYIDRLTATGNTSIDIGMKWGSALLDPSTRSVVNDLVDDGVISETFRNRPTEYDSGDTLKIVILMSDGENTHQYMLNPSMREGLSDVWFNAEARELASAGYGSRWQAYSVFHSNGTKNYYWPAQNDWYDHPYGNAETYEECNSYYCWDEPETGGPNGAVQLPYSELLARVSLASLAYYIHEYSSSAWADWYQSGMYFHNRVAKDQHTKKICDVTKNQGVIVYAVGFEAPKNGTRILQDCASSPAHFFDVEGLEIADAFSSIATSIRQLRLTQ